jgi:hypothetical protein
VANGQDQRSLMPVRPGANVLAGCGKVRAIRPGGAAP